MTAQRAALHVVSEPDTRAQELRAREQRVAAYEMTPERRQALMGTPPWEYGSRAEAAEERLSRIRAAATLGEQLAAWRVLTGEGEGEV